MNIDVLLAGLLGGLAAAAANGVFNHFARVREFEHQQHMKYVELKQQRMQIAIELARFKNEQVMEAAKSQGGKVTAWDPGVSLADYLEAIDEIDDTGRWERGDKTAYPNGVPGRRRPKKEGS